MMHRTRKKKKRLCRCFQTLYLSPLFSFFFLNCSMIQVVKEHTQKKKGCKFLFKGSQRSLNERFYFEPIKKTEEKEANNEKSETVK